MVSLAASDDDQAAADNVADLIDSIYVQKWDETTEDRCKTRSPTALSPQIFLHHLRGHLQLFLKVSSAEFHIPLFHTSSLVPEVTPSKEPSISHFVLA